MSPFAYRHRNYQRVLIEPLETRSHFSVGTDLGWASALASFNNGSVVAAAVAPDGKLVVLSRNWSETDGTTVESLSRFNRDGSLDDSFSVSLSTYTAPTADADGTPTRQASDFTKLLVANDGSIFLAGTTWTEKQVTITYDNIWTDVFVEGDPANTDPSVPTTSSYTYFQAQDGTDLLVRKLSPDSTADSSFGLQGSATIDLGGSDNLTDIALGQGKLVLLGTSYDPASGSFAGDYDLARLTADGSLDTSFGKGGIAVAPLSNNLGWATNVFVTSDGSVLVAGKTYTWDPSPWLPPPVIIDPGAGDSTDDTSDNTDGSTDGTDTSDDSSASTDDSTDDITDSSTDGSDDSIDTTDDSTGTTDGSEDSSTIDDSGDTQTDPSTDGSDTDWTDTSDSDLSMDDSSGSTDPGFVDPGISINKMDHGQMPGDMMPVDPMPTFCIAYPPAMRTTTLTVARFSPDGQLDTSYGDNGLASADISLTALPKYGWYGWGRFGSYGGWGELTLENIAVDSTGQLTFSSATLSQGNPLSSKLIQFSPDGALLDTAGPSAGGSASLSLGNGLSVAFNFDASSDGVLSDDESAALSNALTPPDGYPTWYSRYPMMYAMNDGSVAYRSDGAVIETLVPTTTSAKGETTDTTPAPTIDQPSTPTEPGIAINNALAAPKTAASTTFSRNLIDQLDPQADLLTSVDTVLS
jgi:uncharacterized delta-60 repeat protein